MAKIKEKTKTAETEDKSTKKNKLIVALPLKLKAKKEKSIKNSENPDESCSSTRGLGKSKEKIADEKIKNGDKEKGKDSKEVLKVITNNVPEKKNEQKLKRKTLIVNHDSEDDEKENIVQAKKTKVSEAHNALDEKSKEDRVRFKDIPKIAAEIKNNDTNKLRNIYRICFNKKPEINKMQKELEQFSGLDFSEDSEKYRDTEKFLLSMDMMNFRTICQIFKIKPENKNITLSKKSKNENIDLIMNFLKNPRDIKTTRKRSRKSSKSDLESDVEKNDQEEEEKIVPKSDHQDSSQNAEKEPASEEIKAENKAENNAENKSDDKSENKSDITSKIENFPEGVELFATVKEIVKTANFEEDSVKSIYNKVVERYPNHDLESHKLLIRDLIHAAIGFKENVPIKQEKLDYEI